MHVPLTPRDAPSTVRPAGRASLYPSGAESRIEAVERICAEDIRRAARRAVEAGADPAGRAAALEQLLGTLGRLERYLAGEEYPVAGRLTAADIELWAALVQLAPCTAVVSTPRPYDVSPATRCSGVTSGG
ncbi:glutathione S-transferase domain-containing protein [Streptomyces sp. NPDC093248]|uniref:glutathione S-transferase family protein n=1 Tax=Streptomyces sp. NPDC093248 TaxID=3155072 RepID=UPI0034276668